MALLSLRDVSVGFGGPLLLDHTSIEIERGERVCLVGRNGAGKSTLMKVISGELAPDEGNIQVQGEGGVAFLRQEVPEGLIASVLEVVEGETGRANPSDWERQIRVDDLIEHIGIAPEARFENLSAGLKRRVMLAQGLADAPALLLLDEPTNHLDIEAIAWMERFLLSFKGALLFVTHDRTFLRRLATRILELDRGSITSWSCDYDTFLVRKDALLEEEAKHRAVFDKKLAQEEAWLRQGVKARRTRNEGRVRALKSMRQERQARRERTGQVQLQVQEAPRSGTKAIEAENITFRYGDELVVDDFSTLILRGDRVGLVGPNGVGKSTLLQILLGKLAPQEGILKQGTSLNVAYFDQLREQLDEEQTVRESVAEGNDSVTVNGSQRHVMSYLQDFLFTPDRAMSPVKSLSGGERNRLLLAKLFTRPSNLLVLDEPTNDLDMETLELLEECLLEYKGTILLVSHDRAFLNNVVTELLVFEGNGKIVSVLGGYEDYERMQRSATAAPPPQAKPSRIDPVGPSSSRRGKPRRFLNRERQELEELPAKIEKIESEQKSLSLVLADPSIYQGGSERLAKAQTRAKELESQLEKAYARWEELEQLERELELG